MTRPIKGSVVFLLLLFCWGAAWTAPQLTSTTQTEAGELDPRLLKIFAEACERIAGTPALRCRARMTYDELEVGPDGTDLLVSYAGTVDMAVVRPDKFWASVRTDTFSLDAFFDDGTATLSSPDDNVYGTIPVKGSVGQMLDTVDERAGFSPPLTDLVAADVFERFTTGAKWGRYIGMSDVAGRPCHQLLVRQGSVDWQVWIDVEEKLPRKLALTYRELPLAPRFTALITEWDLETRTADEEFHFTPPADAIRVGLSHSMPPAETGTEGGDR